MLFVVAWSKTFKIYELLKRTNYQTLFCYGPISLFPLMAFNNRPIVNFVIAAKGG